MKPSFILGVLVGYVLGSRAGRERYEDIVRVARRVAGSQTIQSTAGVVQAQVNAAAARAKDHLVAKLPLVHSATAASRRPASTPDGVNGYH